jgi:signal transduction histidine kinase
VRPIRHMRAAAARVAGGDLETRVALEGSTEERSLARSFNDMTDRIRDMLGRQQAFVADASHQLRTPLAALRLRLENLSVDLAPAGAANLRAALVETDRLARMVESLLAMARYEQSALPRERVSLSSVVGERIAFWTPLAAGRSVRLTLAEAPDASVVAVSGAVDQILDNLLSNALDAAPPGSTVAISWRPGAGCAPMVELHVVDEGPGLTAEQCVQAMDPFWRAPGSPSGGTGLGLPLVRKLAEASGGRATLQPAGRRGLDAVITLVAARAPLAPASSG